MIRSGSGEPSSLPCSTTQAKETFEPQLREYGVGVQILSDLGVRKMVLLSNTHRSIIGLEGHDLEITEQRPITMLKEHGIPVRTFYG